MTQIGDLWELGPHRLLCGDAQSAIDMQRVMGTEAARMVIADPPYNLPIRRVQGRGRTKHGNFVQASGEMSSAEFTRFLRAALSLAGQHSVDGAVHFVFIDWRHLGELLAAGSALYSSLKNHRRMGEDECGPRQLLQIATRVDLRLQVRRCAAFQQYRARPARA